MRFVWWIAGLLLVSAPAAAQGEPRCAFLCAPALKIEPTWTIENLGARPSVEADGQVERAARETVFELIFALDVPTTIPRVGLTLEAIIGPFGRISAHLPLGTAGVIDGGLPKALPETLYRRFGDGIFVVFCVLLGCLSIFTYNNSNKSSHLSK